MKKVFAGFIAGQAVQLLVHTIALNLWNHQQIPFCMAGGFVILFAALAGAWLARRDAPQEVDRKGLNVSAPKTEEATVAQLFGRRKPVEDMDEVDALPDEIEVTNTNVRRAEG